MKTPIRLTLFFLFVCQVLLQNTTIVNSTKSYDSVAPKWLTSPYFRAGNQAVIATLTGNSVTPTFTFTFSSALTADPNLAYGIKNYRGNDYLGQEFYQIKKIGLSASTFSVSIQIYGVTNLWLLNVAYLAVQPTFPHHFNTFDNVPLNYSSGDLVNITNNSPSLEYFVEYVNYTQQAFDRNFKTFTAPLASNKIVLFMTSLWIRGTFGLPIEFHINVEVITSDTYLLNATLERNVMITNVHFSEVFFNIDDVESSNRYQIFYYEWVNDRHGGFKAIPQEFVDNFIMGVKSFQMTNAQCGFEYQWEFVNNTGVHGVEILDSWTIGNYCGFSQSRTSVLYISTWLCQAPYLYFNTTTQLCQNLCGQYFFENTNISECQKCSNDFCYQCDSIINSTCIDCQAQLGLILVNGSCVCNDGYYFIPGGCTPCSSFDSGSISCSYNPSSRSAPFDPAQFTSNSCNEVLDFFLSNGSCLACSLPHCADCVNLTSCLTCVVGYSFNKFQHCDLCYVLGCDECLVSDPNFCSISNTAQGFFVDASGQCTSVCGDGLTAVGLQVCDDGNLINGDGCSSTCLIESDHNCYVLPSFLSKCYLLCGDGSQMPAEACDDGNLVDGDGCNSICQLQVSIQLQSIRRDLSRCNTLEFEYVATPSLSFLQSIDFSDLLMLSEPTLKVLEWSYSAPNIRINYDFSTNLEKAELSLLPNTTLMNGYTNFSILFEPQNFTVTPINNVPANFIDEQTCKTKQMYQQAFSLIQIGSFGLLFVALITGKIIGLQLFGVLQLAYFCVGSLDSVNILLSPIMQMKLLNGYSKPFMNSLPQELPNRIKQIDLYPSFLDNFNVMLVVLVGVFLIGLCLYAMLKLLKIRNKNFANFTYRMLKQVLLTVLLFSSLNIAYSSGVYYRFSTKDIYSNVASIGSLSGLVLMALLFPFIEAIGFGEFKDKFKKDPIESNYMTITLIYRILLGFFLAFENESHLSTLLVLGLNLAFILYNLINLPFKKAYHNYRACICHFSQFGIIFATMYYRSMKSNTDTADVAGIYLPAKIEFSLICLCLLVSAVILLYDSVLLVKQVVNSCAQRNRSSRVKMQISQANIMEQVIMVKTNISNQ